MRQLQRLPKRIETLAAAGALFVINHSGGKDSQAMVCYLRRFIAPEQLLIVHAHLDGMEWEGVVDHIRATIGNLELITTRARDKNGNVKTFADIVRHRRMFPSPKQRWCTSDLKRGPIECVIRRVANERGCTQIVNCIGLRAEESPKRARQPAFKKNARLTLKGDPTRGRAVREVLDWLPIHKLSTPQVFRAIREAGEEAHWAYHKAGSSRFSCALCIMAKDKDLAIGAYHNPKVLGTLQQLELETGFTFRSPTKDDPEPFLHKIIPRLIEKHVLKRAAV